MDWPRHCAVVIPCFNEARTIGSLCDRVSPFLPQIVVVDDGSADATAAQAERAGARVLRHARNRGKGAALRTGLSAVRDSGHRWALLLDGDGQHDPRDIPALIRCASKPGAALVVGNRMHDAQSIPWLRRRVNQWMSRQISRRTGVPMPDTQCGFRLLNLAAWTTLELKTSHYEVESEMLLALVGRGFRIEFVPIRVVGRGPCSRINPLLDTCRWFQWWWAARKPAVSLQQAAQLIT